MPCVTFTCETITPMFLAGADGITPELRPPSMKGMLRFWWRAIQGENNLKDLKQRESELFGSSDEGIGRSKFKLRIHHEITEKDISKYKPLPHHSHNSQCNYLPECNSKKKPDKCFKGFTKPAIKPSTKFTIITDADTQIQNLFTIAAILGGIGKRSRRGFGSFSINCINKKLNDHIYSLEVICDLLNLIKNNYTIHGRQIILKKIPVIAYPFIESIQVGQPSSSVDDLLVKIGNASHSFVSDYTGFVDGNKRCSSPLYISVIKDSTHHYLPVATSLKAVFPPGYRPKKDSRQVFMEVIL